MTKGIPQSGNFTVKFGFKRGFFDFRLLRGRCLIFAFQCRPWFAIPAMTVILIAIANSPLSPPAVDALIQMLLQQMGDEIALPGSK